MRSIIFATLSIAALAACEPTQSAQPTTRVASGPDAQACTSLGELGSTIMEVRQKGVPQRELASVINSRLNVDPEVRDLAGGIVEAAYTVPIAPNEAAKRAVAGEFARITRNACLDAVAT